MKYDFQKFLDIKKMNGDELSAFCPFHDDKSPSFSANVSSGLWICHAGCGQGNFLKFLELILSNHSITLRDIKKTNSKKYDRLAKFKTVAEYEYLDVTGEIHLRVIRLENGQKEKRFYQQHRDKSGYWVNGGPTEQVLPYLIQNWSKSESNLLFFVEGEKCADFLMSLGLNATTTPGGASNWNNTFARYFKDKLVIILPDNDKVGIEFANLVLKSILGQNVVGAFIVELPGLNPGEDIVDWISQNRTPNELIENVAHIFNLRNPSQDNS